MKRDSLCTFAAIALLIGFAACTRDGAGTLADGTRPLALTAVVEGCAAARATVDGTWATGDQVGVQVTDEDGTAWYDYKTDDEGNMSGNYYWTNTSSITVQGVYPCAMGENSNRTWTVGEDQSSEADYQSGDVLCSDKQNVDFGRTPALTFYHQTAKVVVNVKQEGLPSNIQAEAGDISLTIGGGGVLTMDGTFTLPTSVDGDGRWIGTWTLGTTKGSINPHLAETAAEGCFATYEALVIPQSVKGGTRLLAFSAEKGGEGYGPFYYTLQADAEWKAGYVYTYDITIFYHGLEVEVSESIGWNAVNTGSGKVSLQDSYDEETKTYYVYTADGLDKWAEMARADLSVNCILMDDIDYEDKEWTAVGYGTASTSSYAGTFDGGGHTIRNIEIKGDASYNGLFGCLGDGGTVKNLTVKNASMATSTGGKLYGIIAGHNNGTIENCVVSSCVIDGDGKRVGCIAGYNYDRISCCRVDDANVSVGDFGGMACLNTGRIEASSFQGHIDADGGALVKTNQQGGTIIACWTDAMHEDGKTVAGIVRNLFGGTVITCYYGGDMDAGILEGSGEAYKVDVNSHGSWSFAANDMNHVLGYQLGPDFGWRWYTNDLNTPPTLVQNN